MWLRLGVILSAVALQVSFIAKSPETLRQRYGKPLSETFRQRHGKLLSETFLVRPGIVVSASYGETGQTCELVIKPKPRDPTINEPGSGSIDDDVLQEIEDELIPKPERGKHIMDTFINIICLTGDDCAGVQSDWQKIMIYRNNAAKATRYEQIRWKRAECRKKEVVIHITTD